MAGTDYAKERLDAHADLKANGAKVVLSTTVGDVIDGGTGQMTPGAAVSVTTYGLLKNYRNSQIDGTLVQKGDLQLLSSAEDLFRANRAPDASWKATVAGTLYRVVWAEPVAPGGIAVLWRIQLRK